MKTKICDHSKNNIFKKYLLNDGTPMIYLRCWDCQHVDEGHVYGDSENWEEQGYTENGVRYLVTQ